MTPTIITHQPHVAATATPRAPQTRVRAEADAVLRDIAFVLQLTRRVRAEIETEQEAASRRPTATAPRALRWPGPSRSRTSRSRG